MSYFENNLLGDFQEEEPMDIPGLDKDSVILDDTREEEPDNLVSVTQSNSDLLNESQLVTVINKLQGDYVQIILWNADHLEEVSDEAHSDPESQIQD